MNRLEVVAWPDVKEQGFPLTVARVEPREYERHAPGILRVMALAYDRQFGSASLGHLPDGAAFDIFDSWSHNRRRAQVARMHSYTAKGSVYWAAYASTDFEPGKDMIGVAKTSPSRPHSAESTEQPNCYVNDIAVRLPRWGTGTGLLWAAVSDFDDDRVVVADALPGSEPFLRHAGLSEGRQLEDLELGDYRIPQVRFEAVSVSGVRAALESNAPWLTEHTRYPADNS